VHSVHTGLAGVPASAQYPSGQVSPHSLATEFKYTTGTAVSALSHLVHESPDVSQCKQEAAQEEH
jgi:hypothetical protein